MTLFQKIPMKTLFRVLIMAIILFALPISKSVNAAQSISVLVDGEQIIFNEQPIIENGTTLIEFRPIFKKLGLNISWDANTRTVIGKSEELEIRLMIDSKIAIINNNESKLEVAPKIIKGYTFVPLRIIGEASGKSVTWYSETKTIQIGKQKIKLINGDSYLGDMKDGKYMGEGTYIFSNGTKYVGEWKDNLFNGIGTYTFNDGMKYIGDWQDGLKNGQGILTYSDGYKYSGDWLNDKRNGNCTIEFENGNKYTGEVKNDKLNGQGKMTFSDGSIYEGGFMDDNYSGYGKYTWINGYYESGLFTNSQLFKLTDSNFPKDTQGNLVEVTPANSAPANNTPANNTPANSTPTNSTTPIVDRTYNAPNGYKDSTGISGFQLVIGMSTDDLKRGMGNPTNVNTNGTEEKWTYATSVEGVFHYFYFVNNKLSRFQMGVKN
jgi:hypothetical protein